MDNLEQPSHINARDKYFALLNIISETQNRLGWTELVFLSLDVALLIFAMGFTVFVHNRGVTMPFEIAFIILCLAIGLSLSTYWIATAMRLQLKLKLRFFQARFLERKIGPEEEGIYSNEAVFFDENFHSLESPDKKEQITYPSSGLTGLDGLIGSAKPRHLSWFMPGFFSLIYIIMFFWVLLEFVMKR
jgi:hypothetical protein